MLHVTQVSFFSDPHKRPADELLQAWSTVVDVAEAVAASNVQVSVIQASSRWDVLERNSVRYHFLPCGHIDATRAGVEGLRQLLAQLKPDVLHVQGLGFAPQVLRLAAMAPQTPILIQDHASQPPRFWRRPLWRRGLAVADGVAFCARAQAQPFIDRGLLQSRTAIYEIPESTSRFSPGNMAEARSATGLSGDPCLLWVGHLNENKDPLTVLKGVSEAARTLPGVRLWCCFGTAPLMREVQAHIAADPMLRDRVYLLGAVAHDRIETLMRAADLFVLGSHREGSGYSVIEALACGLPPVVTDIPSFRSLSADGAVGRLWSCGNVQSLSQAIVQMAAQPRDAARAAARSHFERELSFEAVGRKLAAAYQDVLRRRCSPTGTLDAFGGYENRVCQ